MTINEQKRARELDIVRSALYARSSINATSTSSSTEELDHRQHPLSAINVTVPGLSLPLPPPSPLLVGGGLDRIPGVNGNEEARTSPPRTILTFRTVSDLNLNESAAASIGDIEGRNQDSQLSSTTTTSSSSSLAPLPLLPPPPHFENLLVNNASVLPAQVGAPNNSGGLIPPSSPNAMLPMRVGGVRIQWDEVDVTSNDAYQRVLITGKEVYGDEQREACLMLKKALLLRHKHLHRKEEYYWGSLRKEDFPHSPQSRELRPFNEFGIRLPLRPRHTNHHPLRSHSSSVDSIASPGGGLSSSSSINSSHPLHPLPTHHRVVSAAAIAATTASSSAMHHSQSALEIAGGGIQPGIAAATTGLPSTPKRGGIAPGGAGGVNGSLGGHSSSLSPQQNQYLKDGSGGAASPLVQRLFYRRRPEPRFEPFNCQVLPRVEGVQFSFVGGVIHVYENVKRSTVPGIKDPSSVSSSSTSSEFDLDGLHSSGTSSLNLPTLASSTTINATTSSSSSSSSSSTNVSDIPNLRISSASSSSSSSSPSQRSLFRIGEETPRDLIELETTAGELESLDSESPVVIDSTEYSQSLQQPSPRRICEVPSWREFSADYTEMLRILHNPAVRTLSYRRLELLAASFRLHSQLNGERESQEQRAVPHRDFYNVRKVDTHVHHSACMNQKHLLRFIKSKLRKEPDTVVCKRDSQNLTLAQVFDSLHLTAYDLSIDMLDMHADNSTFHRFDRFNTKYNPQGSSRLREIFLKTDNLIGGRFLAEITKEVLDDLSTNKYQLAEYRLSIYGRSKSEWSKLAAWVVNNRLVNKEVRWMIQVPRLYEVYKAGGQIRCFQDMLDNIFSPLFEVSLDPSVDPVLHQFLSVCVGLDSVDDESRPEVEGSDFPEPSEWNFPQQPPYHYWTYFLAANLATLNKLRQSRGLTQFSFRPHAGEAGDVEHLAATFLTAESINHGINLRRNPSLQYLYYLAQIGLAMSPLSNNRLFLELSKCPFADFFAKGLNVSLSTDDPLMLAITKEPLLEEYAVASQVFKLSSADMCEVARSSVLQSGFEYPHKAHFLGANFAEPGPDGNDIHYSNVPFIRTQFRFEALRAELELIRDGSDEATFHSSAAAAASKLHKSVSVIQSEQPRTIVVKGPGGGGGGGGGGVYKR